jgi:hypothetical protein
VNAVEVAQQGAVDVEEIGILPIPGETRFDCDTSFAGVWVCRHVF